MNTSESSEQSPHPLTPQIERIMRGNVDAFNERVHDWPEHDLLKKFPDRFAMRYKSGVTYFTLIRHGDKYLTFPTGMLVEHIDGLSSEDVYNELANAGYTYIDSNRMPEGVKMAPDDIVRALRELAD